MENSLTLKAGERIAHLKKKKKKLSGACIFNHLLIKKSIQMGCVGLKFKFKTVYNVSP